eukprot:TRINITY_DN7869_c0_g3_i2.p1 TRINITY_DN7869_c0_g3~~TRINITY_DN7869_c0_g3_i2.p1  ORF type:complete len:540 (-),score=99.42 TRINITY_DN7869_c0_g3_i2:207-1826(-)
MSRQQTPRRGGYPTPESRSGSASRCDEAGEGDDEEVVHLSRQPSCLSTPAASNGPCSSRRSPSSGGRLSPSGIAGVVTGACAAGNNFAEEEVGEDSGRPPSRACSVRLPSINASRAASLGAAGRRSSSSSAVSRSQLAITVTTELEGIEFDVHLTEGELERRSEGFPATLPKGSTTVTYRSSNSLVGEVRVENVPPVPFGVQVEGAKSAAPGGRINWVSTELRQRTLVAGAGQLELGSGMGARGEGTAVDVTISDGYNATMTVVIRRAKKKELTKLAQEQALVSAMERGRYSSLLAQISRSKMRKVPAALIEQANRLLKSIQPADGTFLTHNELSKLMRWKRVTCPAGGTEDRVETCSGSEDCPCNAGQAQAGETCDVLGGSVHEALDGVAPSEVPADMWLFKALVKAALTAPEGCVWKSGGKFLLSNEERNQSPTAIVNVLERDNQESDAGKGIRALVAYTEREYGFRVTAIQLNFHPNQKSGLSLQDHMVLAQAAPRHLRSRAEGRHQLHMQLHEVHWHGMLLFGFQPPGSVRDHHR